MSNIKYFEVSLEYKLQSGINIKTKEYYDTLYDVSSQFDIKVERLHESMIYGYQLDNSPIVSIKVVENKPPIKVEISDYSSFE